MESQDIDVFGILKLSESEAKLSIGILKFCITFGVVFRFKTRLSNMTGKLQ